MRSRVGSRSGSWWATSRPGPRSPSWSPWAGRGLAAPEQLRYHGPPEGRAPDGRPPRLVGDSCRLAVGVDPSDVMLPAVPVYHSYGIDHGALDAALRPRLFDVHAGFDAPACGRPRRPRGQGVAGGAADARFPGRRRRRKVPKPRCDTSSPPATAARRVAERFAVVYGVPVGQIGASEFGSVAYNHPGVWDRGPDDPFLPRASAGRFPGAGSASSIVTPAARAARRGRAGRRGRPSMLAGCLNDVGSRPVPASSSPAISAGSTRGPPHLTGRVKLMIDVAGMKVNPLEVESVLANHPGVPDDRRAGPLHRYVFAPERHGHPGGGR